MNPSWLTGLLWLPSGLVAIMLGVVNGARIAVTVVGVDGGSAGWRSNVGAAPHQILVGPVEPVG